MRVEVNMMDGGRPAAIEARAIAPLFALHATPGPVWTVTHVPTGLAAYRCEDEVVAGRVMRALSVQAEWWHVAESDVWYDGERHRFFDEARFAHLFALLDAAALDARVTVRATKEVTSAPGCAPRMPKAVRRHGKLTPWRHEKLTPA